MRYRRPRAAEDRTQRVARRGSASAVGILALAVLAGGCSTSSATEHPLQSTLSPEHSYAPVNPPTPIVVSPTPKPAPTRTATATTASAGTAQWQSYGACPRTSIRQLPPGSGCATRAFGDFDGDGTTDRFIVYAHPLAADGTAEGWHMLLLLGDGQQRAGSLPLDTVGHSNEGVVTTLDANRDGRNEALVLIQGGNQLSITRLYALFGDRLAPVHGANGRPFDFEVGGTAIASSGAGCRIESRQPMLYTSGYRERDGRWPWTRTFYRWDGPRMVAISTQRGFTTLNHASNYGQFTCFSRHLGDVPEPKVVY